MRDTNGIFESLSHPIRIRIIRMLYEGPMGFSELKARLSLESSGKLDFYLKKLKGFVEKGEDGKYTLTKEGYAALEAVKSIERYGWQRRAYYVNFLIFLFVNCFSTLTGFRYWLIIVLPLTAVWMAFYTYWAVKKRRIFSIV